MNAEVGRNVEIEKKVLEKPTCNPPETGTFSISGTEGKTINRPYPSDRWEITSPVPRLQMLLNPPPLCLFPRNRGPDLVPAATVPDQFT